MSSRLLEDVDCVGIHCASALRRAFRDEGMTASLERFAVAWGAEAFPRGPELPLNSRLVCAAACPPVPLDRANMCAAAPALLPQPSPSQKAAVHPAGVLSALFLVCWSQATNDSHFLPLRRVLHLTAAHTPSSGLPAPSQSWPRWPSSSWPEALPGLLCCW